MLELESWEPNKFQAWETMFFLELLPPFELNYYLLGWAIQLELKA
jgi:hypothetical protein